MLRSLRLGHATNSSSAHSIIFHPAHDARVADALPHTSINEICEFSRDRFSFSEAREKALYLLRDLADTDPSNHVMIEVAQVLRRHGLDGLLGQLETIDLPLERQGPLAYEAARKGGVSMADWLDFMLSPHVTCYGYDDNNDDPGMMLDADGVAVRIDRGLIWKKDGPAIVAYEPARGTKLRWSRQDYDKAQTPELVDVKITDFCGYGCSFCYQGSTKAGQHAPLDCIETIFDQLAAMRVFEVAIGGGEPAHHPQFAQIIEAANARGMTFNFTAFGLDWTKNERALEALKAGHGNGIGISVHSKRDIVKLQRAREALREHGVWRTSVMAQTVVGATPMPAIHEMLEACVAHHAPLLLLGFKETGRGAGYGRARASDAAVRKLLLRARAACEESREEYSPFTLSVDTAFLDSYGHLLDELGVPHSLRTSPEGKFSMYVDAVENTCGPSSYCDPALMAPIGDIRTQFAAY